MSAQAVVTGTRQTYKARTITSASYTTLVPAPERLFTLDSVLLSNITASAATVTLEIYDGVAATSLPSAFSIAANTPYLFKDHNITLGPLELLRVKSGTAGAFDVTVVGFEGRASG